MEPTSGIETRSSPNGRLPDVTRLESLQFREEIQRLITEHPENGTSFTALLELPATQAMELLGSSKTEGVSKRVTLFNDDHKPYFHSFSANSTAPPSSSPVQHVATFSGFWGSSRRRQQARSRQIRANLDKVKSEPIAEEANLTPNSQSLIFDPSVENANQKSTKRKEREKKGKGLTKKSKGENSDDSEKLPYVHVRARRGQATDSHSLAERARREKINARMKLLQELVPGCNKISGTALVLDEIINHVQSLQSQVEFLSMRIAAVYPRIDLNLDRVFAAESGSVVASNFPGMVTTPFMWPNRPPTGNIQQYHHQWHPEDSNQNSLLTYDSSPISASLRSSQLKTEL